MVSPADFFQGDGYAPVVERILLHVGWRDVLSASAVCVNLNNLVTSSSALQLVLRRAFHAILESCARHHASLTSGAQLERLMDIETRWAGMQPKRVDLLEAPRAYVVLASDGLLVTITSASIADQNRLGAEDGFHMDHMFDDGDDFSEGDDDDSGEDDGWETVSGDEEGDEEDDPLNDEEMARVNEGREMGRPRGREYALHGPLRLPEPADIRDPDESILKRQNEDEMFCAGYMQGFMEGMAEAAETILDEDESGDDDGASADDDESMVVDFSSVAAHHGAGAPSDDEDDEDDGDGLFANRAIGWTVRDCTNLRDTDIASVPTWKFKTDFLFHEADVCRADNVICVAAMHRKVDTGPFDELAGSITHVSLHFFLLEPTKRIGADVFKDGTPIPHPHAARGGVLESPIDMRTAYDSVAGYDMNLAIKLLPQGVVHVHCGGMRAVWNWKTGKRIMFYTEREELGIEDSNSHPIARNAALTVGQQTYFEDENGVDDFDPRLVIALVEGGRAAAEKEKAKEKAKEKEKEQEKEKAKVRLKTSKKRDRDESDDDTNCFFDVEPGREGGHVLFPLTADPYYRRQQNGELVKSFMDPDIEISFDETGKLFAISANNADGDDARNAYTAVFLADKLRARLHDKKPVDPFNLDQIMDITDLAFYDHSYSAVSTHSFRAFTVEQDDFTRDTDTHAWRRYALRVADYRFRDAKADLVHSSPLASRLPSTAQPLDPRAKEEQRVTYPTGEDDKYVISPPWDWGVEDGTPVETTMFESNDSNGKDTKSIGTAGDKNHAAKKKKADDAKENKDKGLSTWKAKNMGRPGTAVAFAYRTHLGEIHCVVLDSEHAYMCLGKRMFILSF